MLSGWQAYFWQDFQECNSDGGGNKGYSSLLENNPEVLNLRGTATGVLVGNDNGSQTSSQNYL
jgi:hypothetical protein